MNGRYPAMGRAGIPVPQCRGFVCLDRTFEGHVGPAAGTFDGFI